MPLTDGALTIAAADRILGGHAEWREVWMLLFRRLGKLLSAVIPAAIVITLGCLYYVIPGLVLALLLRFVSPVVLMEAPRRAGGAGAEHHAGPVRLAAGGAGADDVRRRPHSWPSWWRTSSTPLGHLCVSSSLLSDLFTMVMLPIPVLGTVLLYFDVRRKRENFTNDNLRTDLDALKGV